MPTLNAPPNTESLDPAVIQQMKALETVIATTDFVAHRTRNISWAQIKRGRAAKHELLDLQRRTGQSRGLGQRPYAMAKRLEPGLPIKTWAKLVRLAIAKGYPVEAHVRAEAEGVAR